MRYIGYFFFCVIIFSCGTNDNKSQNQDRLFEENYQQVLGEVKNMIQEDQNIRKAANYGTADTIKIDSLVKEFDLKGINLDSVLLLNDTFLVSNNFVDSVHKIMGVLATKHTQRLIALIDKYGYPASDRIDTTSKISPFILLHHPDLSYKDTMMKLLKKELILGRMDTISYEMIKWSYSGRKGLPNIPNMKVQKNTDGTVTIHL